MRDSRKFFSKIPDLEHIFSMAEWHKPGRRAGARIVSLIVTITFVFPYLAWAFESGSFFKPDQVLFNNRPIEISGNLGKIIQSSQGKDRLVVHVQDLHCNYEVQSNIARMIHVLAQQHGLKLVAVEGAAMPVNVTKLSTFPLEEVKKQTAEYLMKQGKVTGAEMYAITGKHPIWLEGIENPDLYEANWTSVMKFLNNESQGYIFDLRESLNELKNGVYNRKLAGLDKKKQAFREGDMSLLKYSVLLYRYGAQWNLNPKAYPNLRAYAARHRHVLSKAVDSDGLFKELDQLDRDLRAGLYTDPDQEAMDSLQYRLDIMEKLLNISATPEELAEFRADPQSFRVQRFLDYIAEHDKSGEIRLDAEMYNLDRYLDEVKEFYQVADERSRAFVENTLSRMNRHNTPIALLVTGGYHTAEVVSELKAHGISYICVKPRLRHQDIVNPYFFLLQKRRTPLEKLLAQNQNILGLKTFFVETLNPKKIIDQLTLEPEKFLSFQLIDLINIAATLPRLWNRIAKKQDRNLETLRHKYQKMQREMAYYSLLTPDFKTAGLNKATETLLVKIKNLKNLPARLAVVIQPKNMARGVGKLLESLRVGKFKVSITGKLTDTQIAEIVESDQSAATGLFSRILTGFNSLLGHPGAARIMIIGAAMAAVGLAIGNFSSILNGSLVGFSGPMARVAEISVVTSFLGVGVLLKTGVFSKSPPMPPANSGWKENNPVGLIDSTKIGEFFPGRLFPESGRLFEELLDYGHGVEQKPLKIAIMGSINTDGGVSHYTLPLDEGLRSLGCDVTVFTHYRESPHGKPLEVEDESHIIRCYTTEGKEREGFKPWDREVIQARFERENFDILLVEDFGEFPMEEAAEYFAEIKETTKTKIYLFNHDNVAKPGDSIFWKVKWDGIINYLPGQNNFVAEHYNPEKIYRIDFPCFPTPKLDKTQARKDLGLPSESEKKIILTFGEYDFVAPFKALDELRRANPTTYLMALVYTEEDKQKLEHSLSELGYAKGYDEIRVKGACSWQERAQFVRAADIVLLHKSDDGTGEVISSTACQIMPWGTPIVLQKNDFSESFGGTIAQYTNDEELKEQISELLANPKVARKRQAAYAKKRTPAVIAGEFLEVFNPPPSCGEIEKISQAPIIAPRPEAVFTDRTGKEIQWEKLTFNAATVKIGGVTYVIYRALGYDGISRLGLWWSEDGITESGILATPIFEPEIEYGELPGDLEARQQKQLKKYKQIREAGGIEDPRIVRIKARLYMTYTAFGDTAQIALASIGVKDFVEGKWDKWKKHGLVYPGVSNKDAVLLNYANGLLLFHRFDGENMYYQRFDNIDGLLEWIEEVKAMTPEQAETAMVENSKIFMKTRAKGWDSDKIGAGAQPIETEYGWLQIYHAKKEATEENPKTYMLGVVLTSLENPTRIIYRSPEPILIPGKKDGFESWVPETEIVFTCGAVPAGKDIYIYYGWGDRLIYVGKAAVSKLIPEEIREKLTPVEIPSEIYTPPLSNLMLTLDRLPRPYEWTTLPQTPFKPESGKWYVEMDAALNMARRVGWGDLRAEYGFLGSILGSGLFIAIAGAIGYAKAAKAISILPRFGHIGDIGHNDFAQDPAPGSRQGWTISYEQGGEIYLDKAALVCLPVFVRNMFIAHEQAHTQQRHEETRAFRRVREEVEAYRVMYNMVVSRIRSLFIGQRQAVQEASDKTKLTEQKLKEQDTVPGPASRIITRAREIIKGTGEINVPFSIPTIDVLRRLPRLYRLLIFIPAWGLHRLVRKEVQGYTFDLDEINTRLENLKNRALSGELAFASENALEFVKKIKLDVSKENVGDFSVSDEKGSEKLTIEVPACVLAILVRAKTHTRESWMERNKYALAESLFIHILKYQGIRYSAHVRTTRSYTEQLLKTAEEVDEVVENKRTMAEVTQALPVAETTKKEAVKRVTAASLIEVFIHSLPGMLEKARNELLDKIPEHLADGAGLKLEEIFLALPRMETENPALSALKILAEEAQRPGIHPATRDLLSSEILRVVFGILYGETVSRAGPGNEVNTDIQTLEVTGLPQAAAEKILSAFSTEKTSAFEPELEALQETFRKMQGRPLNALIPVDSKHRIILANMLAQQMDAGPLRQKTQIGKSPRGETISAQQIGWQEFKIGKGTLFGPVIGIIDPLVGIVEIFKAPALPRKIKALNIREIIAERMLALAKSGYWPAPGRSFLRNIAMKNSVQVWLKETVAAVGNKNDKLMETPFMKIFKQLKSDEEWFKFINSKHPFAIACRELAQARTRKQQDKAEAMLAACMANIINPATLEGTEKIEIDKNMMVLNILAFSEFFKNTGISLETIATAPGSLAQIVIPKAMVLVIGFKGPLGGFLDSLTNAGFKVNYKHLNWLLRKGLRLSVKVAA